MRRLTLPLASLLVLPLLGSDAPTDYDGVAAPADELEGTWRLVAVRADPGQPFAQVERSGEITYRGGHWSSRFGFAARAGTYTTDAGRRHLDAAPESGRGGARRYLYRVEFDRLWVASAEGGRVRPQSFDHEGVTVNEYERVKK
jgi:hypothetical protein